MTAVLSIVALVFAALFVGVLTHLRRVRRASEEWVERAFAYGDPNKMTPIGLQYRAIARARLGLDGLDADWRRATDPAQPPR